jgi:hypothetical protein
MHRQIGILWDLDLKLSTAHSSASVPLHVIGFFFTSIHEGPRAMKKVLLREGWFPKIPKPAEANMERSWL